MFHRLSRIIVLLTVAMTAVGFVAPVGIARAEAYPLVPAVECRVRGGMPNVLAKLRAGKAVRIAYLGGSITAQKGWRPKTLAWFGEQYPDARVSEINAAIGGTGSDLGCFRLAHDVLRHDPDLLFVEFAVNDGGAPPENIYRSMEGIVRQTWRHDPTTDICFVYTITKSLVGPMLQGQFPRAASADERVAEHYAIPSIHMAMEVARLAKADRLVWAAGKPKTDAEREALGGKMVFARDGVHPYPDTGHELYLEAVVRGVKAMAGVGRPGPHALPEPLRADNWERATMVPLSRLDPGDGWTHLDPASDGMAKRWSNRLPEVWKTPAAGARLHFRFKGTTAAVYDLLGPDCGQVSVTLDDRKPVVRPRFDRYCTYHRLATLPIGRDLPDAVHTVTLQLLPDPPDKAAIFKKGHQDAEDPATNPKYRGINWYAGAVLLVGELVE